LGGVFVHVQIGSNVSRNGLTVALAEALGASAQKKAQSNASSSSSHLEKKSISSSSGEDVLDTKDFRDSFLKLDKKQRDQCNGLSWTVSQMMETQIKRSLDLLEQTPWLLVHEVEIEMKRCVGIIFVWLSRIALATRTLSHQLQTVLTMSAQGKHSTNSQLCANVNSNFRCIEHAVHEARRLLKIAKDLYQERSQTLLSVNSTLKNILHHLDVTAKKLLCLCRNTSPKLHLILSSTSIMETTGWRVLIVT